MRVRPCPRVARTHTRVRADALESREGVRNLGGTRRVGGRRSERVNGENNLKNISFTQFQIC
jgi:hypothetical protein